MNHYQMYITERMLSPLTSLRSSVGLNPAMIVKALFIAFPSQEIPAKSWLEVVQPKILFMQCCNLVTCLISVLPFSLQ